MDKTEIVLDLLQEMFPSSYIGISTDLIDTGILSSLDLYVLISRIEETFDIRIPENMISPDNFTSVKSIIKLLSDIL